MLVTHSVTFTRTWTWVHYCNKIARLSTCTALVPFLSRPGRGGMKKMTARLMARSVVDMPAMSASVLAEHYYVLKKPSVLPSLLRRLLLYGILR